jgi:peptidoglycan/LPS O-acetylase OafA/YrhL
VTRIGIAAAVLVLALADAALACPGCLSSAYGDRTFNWAFLGLLLMPFAVAGGIAAVLLYAYRRRPPDRLRHLTPKETT